MKKRTMSQSEAAAVGGRARALHLTRAERTAIARKAAAARWGKRKRPLRVPPELV